ncbi:MAG: ribosome recycling factor [Endomicrobium sp.]|jgi:ribosome recycling factor|nr:ribosome recycling factor [Endomicrobium sp.]
MQVQSFFSASQEAMKKTIDRLKCELSAVRTGRASSTVIENIKIESYGTIMVAINQVASVSVPDAKTIEVRPWDISQLGVIEKSILKADIGMTPINDGKLIRVKVPPLTEERRKEIAKSIGRMAEDFRVTVRNERRTLFENIKKLEKDKIITEDDRKKFEVEAQKITDNFVKLIDELIASKEKEVMQI